MSCGAAQAMVHAWLLNVRSIVFEGRAMPEFLRCVVLKFKNRFSFLFFVTLITCLQDIEFQDIIFFGLVVCY